MSWGKCKDTAQLCGDDGRKAKGQVQLYLQEMQRTVLVSQKRRVKESIVPLMNITGKQVTTDEEKAGGFNNFFSSVFTSNLSSHTSPVDGLQDRDQRAEVPPTASKDQLCDHLRKLNIGKSVGPDEMHLKSSNRIG